MTSHIPTIRHRLQSRVSLRLHNCPLNAIIDYIHCIITLSNVALEQNITSFELAKQ